MRSITLNWRSTTSYRRRPSTARRSGGCLPITAARYAGIQDPTNPGHEFAGLNPHAASSRGDGVVALARTDDVEAAVASVLAAGGRIVVELNEYPGGRRFMFADPWGNILGIYQPGE
jgi:predicted enzyme related to lactoylglutathione lyase